MKATLVGPVEDDTTYQLKTAVRGFEQYPSLFNVSPDEDVFALTPDNVLPALGRKAARLAKKYRTLLPTAAGNIPKPKKFVNALIRQIYCL